MHQPQPEGRKQHPADRDQQHAEAREAEQCRNLPRLPAPPRDLECHSDEDDPNNNNAPRWKNSAT